MLLFLAPLAAVLSIELSIVASARVSDARAAQRLGALMFTPFMGIYIGAEIGLISLDTNTLLIISGILAALDPSSLPRQHSHFPERRDSHKVEVIRL